ncbi:hypothetical protein AXF42_Ash014379 [Apostasia shenzhenica]|uniref:LisH domain-containing protein n=1 Tax=Apostasia shenzhenica TaxID=1088818 RepID=A0A2I0B0Y6_9ASPA|nr:hypothetical protein AXF42_Ash014379 [Apostasia shenzhenica]
MDPSRSMNVERSSLCNCVVNFLLEEGYQLTAFELLHELLEDGRHDQAIRLREYFSDPSLFPSDQIARFNSIRGCAPLPGSYSLISILVAVPFGLGPKSITWCKRIWIFLPIALGVRNLHDVVAMKLLFTNSFRLTSSEGIKQASRKNAFREARYFIILLAADPQTLLEEKQVVEEKLAVSEYELRLAHEDVSRLKSELEKLNAALPDNCPDAPTNGLRSQRDKKESTFSSLGPLNDAERRDLNCAVKEYLLVAGYRLTAMTFIEEVTDQNFDAWPNKSAHVTDALRRYYYQYLSSTAEAAEEKIALLQENESLVKENLKLSREKGSLMKSIESADVQIANLSKYLEAAQKDLKERDVLVQSLKQSMELQRKELNECRAEITSLKMHIEGSRASRGWNSGENEALQSLRTDQKEESVRPQHTGLENTKGTKFLKETTKPIVSQYEENQPEEKVLEMNEAVAATSSVYDSRVENIAFQNVDSDFGRTKPITTTSDALVSCNGNAKLKKETIVDQVVELSAPENSCLIHKKDSPRKVATLDKLALETIQIVSDALPKIVPYVLINHREACVSLAKNVGEVRTETELLPQCWEQINHMYEERRLLVAQSCGELAQFVRPEIRDSLILSIVQQLVEDSATVVREAAAHNLAMLLPLFPNMDKYFKVEELLFQLVCDPSGVVVDATLQELLPAVIKWGDKLNHILRVLFSHILGAAQRCPPLSGVEGSVDSQLRVLGEHERWNIDVLLRMMIELLPFVHQRCIDSCPIVSATKFPAISEQGSCFFSSSLLQSYAQSNVEWPAFDWMYVDCFPDLIQLACLLPHKEDNLRTRITKFLLAVSDRFGDQYLAVIMLPVFLISVGDIGSAVLKYFPVSYLQRVKGLLPKTALAERVALACVLPLLLSGILGSPGNQEGLSNYLRKILQLDTTTEISWLDNCRAEVMDAARFLCTFEEHHGTVCHIVWELVACSDANMKINAANLLKVLVPYVNEKLASTHVLPALVTLGSDQNLNVRYASIDAFGVVAQHFKNDVIVDKIRIQMDAFLEDRSYEAIICFFNHSIHLLSMIFQLTSMPSHGIDVVRRRSRANAFCEAIRALDATDLPPSCIRDFLIPSVQNLLKDHDNLDPAHKEALEIIMKERSGGAFESISKVMGAHLGIASSMSSFFGDSATLRAKKETADINDPAAAVSPVHQSPHGQHDDTRFRRIMMGGFGDLLRGKARGPDDSPK